MKYAIVVDDTKNIRLLLHKTLELEGFKVDNAATGLEALEKIRRNTYDLIFLDVKLPEISGTEVLRRIREEGIETPVIVVTAYPTVKNAVDCVKLGAITYLQKPFTGDRLKNILKQYHLSADDVDTKPGKSHVWVEIDEAFEQGNYAKAIQLLSSLLADNPSDADIYKHLADAYRKIGSDDTAAKFESTYKIFKNK